VKSTLSWVVAAIAGAVVLVIGFVIAALWIGIGDSEISRAGWLAMGLGVIVTLALGIGLMALVFISSRAAMTRSAAETAESSADCNEINFNCRSYSTVG